MSEGQEHYAYDDENYIYLDKDGNAQKRVELTVNWEPIPATKFLVTCNSTDSLGYLRYLIGEVLEKYSNFSGLTSLQACSLTNNKITLPENGIISDYLKTGDHLSCDISSLDLWLEVKIESPDVPIVIFFEIKVQKASTIRSFKYALIDIANQLYVAKNFNLIFDEEHAEIMKIGLENMENVLCVESKSALSQSMSVIKQELIDNDFIIGDVFSYIQHFLMLKLTKKPEDFKEKPGTIPSYTVSDSYIQISSTMPIRTLRVEPQAMHRNTRNKFQSVQLDDEEQDAQKNCKCCLF